MRHDSSFSRHAGFTLLELSVVLTVIGILVGAIVGGQHLLHTLRLRKIQEDLQHYQSALMLFNVKYQALPGDMKRATDYWGAVDTVPTGGCMAPNFAMPYGPPGNGFASGSGTKTCNGNGDDKIGDWDLPALYSEMFRAWQHLYNAGFITQHYTGISGGTGNMDHEANVNAPGGALNASSWGIIRLGDYQNTFQANQVFFTGRQYGNSLIFGAEKNGFPPMNPILTPQEARAIDQKIDDAQPGKGNVTTVLSTSLDIALCTDKGGNSSEVSQQTAIYNMTTDKVACSLYFVLPEEVRGLRTDTN